jgi:hypothetical protein
VRILPLDIPSEVYQAVAKDDVRDTAVLVGRPFSAHPPQDIKVYHKHPLVLGSLDEGDKDLGGVHREVYSPQVASKDNLDRRDTRVFDGNALLRDTSISEADYSLGDRHEDNEEDRRQPAVAPDDKPNDKRDRIAVVHHRAPSILAVDAVGDDKDHRCCILDASWRRCIRVLDS